MWCCWANLNENRSLSFQGFSLWFFLRIRWAMPLIIMPKILFLSINYITNVFFILQGQKPQAENASRKGAKNQNFCKHFQRTQKITIWKKFVILRPLPLSKKIEAPLFLKRGALKGLSLFKKFCLKIWMWSTYKNFAKLF